MSRMDTRPFVEFPDQRGTFYAPVDEILLSIRPPPCSCVDCQTGYFTVEEQKAGGHSYRLRISDAEARCLVDSYTKKIHENRNYLADRLKSHADLLMSRWRKRNQEKRQNLLAEAAPDLAIDPWHLFHHSYMEEPELLNSRTSRKQRQLLVPWLNVNMLKTNPAILYALLHYRVAYPPQEWAAFDCRQFTTVWAAGKLDVDFNENCVVLHGPRYGTLVKWEKNAAHRADILGFPRAQLVLEVQAFILTTLRSIVDKILEGVDDSTPARTQKWSELTATKGFRHIGEVESWSPYTNQAFSAPLLLDPEYLVSLAKTRVEASGDHLWHLQCDPAYMRRYIKTRSQTSIYKAANENENRVQIASAAYQEVIYHHWWNWVEIECRNVADLHKRFRDNIYPGNPLPARYDQALGSLELLLVNQILHLIKELSNTIPFCPGFSRHWKISRDDSGPLAYANLERKSSRSVKKQYQEDPLDWCLNQLMGGPDQQTMFDHAMLFAFLQSHLSRSGSAERARVDECLYRSLSDLATYHEMLVAVRLSRPQNKARHVDEVMQSEADRDRPGWKCRRCKNSPPFMENKDVLRGLNKSGKVLLENFYAKPIAGPRNMEWIRQSRENRAALESFWVSIRGLIRKDFVSDPFTKEEIDGLLDVISADKTTEYTEAIREEENKILADIERSNIAPVLQHLSLHDSDPKAKPEAKASRQKIKTRPDSTVVQPPITSSPPDDTPSGDSKPDPDPNNLIIVSQRSLHIFNSMFPETAEESVKTVVWEDFVVAVREVGFTARNNGGSAVLFESIHGGKIVFHKPHPIAKIDSVMLKSMGKRMAKWFGWGRERFALADGGTGKLPKEAHADNK
ncbi:hypothetical protein F5Y04DRAFT_73414 [Hypomontagnella monticulosa]|nr:hypothetical protein F5Y04DRAFT_73414 [Hypomontagnella monticulosa]